MALSRKDRVYSNVHFAALSAEAEPVVAKGILAHRGSASDHRAVMVGRTLASDAGVALHR